MAPEDDAQRPTAAPKTMAPPSAKGRIGGGARLAGTTVQKAWACLPRYERAVRLQLPPGHHQGWKAGGPGKLLNVLGRRRPQFPLSRRLDVSPGPIRKEPRR
jgi:hypothetical protein